MYFENIIIGAGPAGLQAGYYLHKYEIDYIILEKYDKCGASFETLPHSGHLLSINKKNIGSINKDLTFRNDYNSLINDKHIYLSRYSNHFYPKRDDMITYLNEYCENNSLNIEFNSNVVKVEKMNEDGKKLKLNYKITVLKENNDEIFYECDRIFVATGLNSMIIPENFAKLSDGNDSNIKHYGQYTKDYFLNESSFINKRVLLVGGGNSSYEVANMIYKVANSVVIMSKSEQKIYNNTKYFGHAHSLYLQDNITISENISTELINIEMLDNKYHLYYKIYNRANESDFIKEGIYGENSNFDIIILCTGWKLDKSIFNFSIDMTKNDKYPLVGINYGSINNKNLFFIGEPMHLFDYGKSSGGFIHGFRHLIKSCIHQLFGLSTQSSFKKFDIFNNHGFNFIEFNKLINYIIERINNTSSLYHMHGILSDKFYLLANGDMLYLHDIHINNMLDIENRAKEMETNINKMREAKENKAKEAKENKEEKEETSKLKKEENKEDSKLKEETSKLDVSKDKKKYNAQFRMLQLMEKKEKKPIIMPTIKTEPAEKLQVEIDITLFVITLEYELDKETQMPKSNKLHPVLRMFSSKSKKYIDLMHFDDNIFENFSASSYKDKLARAIKGYIAFN